MKEVSCRVVSCCIDELRGKNLPESLLFEGVDLSPGYLLNEVNRISWDDYCLMMRNLRRLLGGSLEEMERFGFEKVIPSSGQEGFKRICGLCTNAKSVVWVAHKVGIHHLFSNLNTEFVELERNRIKFVINILPEWQDSEEFFWICKGVYRAIAFIIGQKENLVDLEYHPRKGIYHIVVQTDSLYVNAKVFIKNLFKVGTIFNEMSYQQGQLRNTIMELERNYAELLRVEQEKNLLLKRLKDTNLHLEVKVMERTKDLEAKNFTIEQMLLEKRQFLSILIHDVANPLTILNHYVQKIHGDLQEQKKHEESDFEKLLVGLGQINKIIRYVRELEALKNGKLNVIMTSVSLKEVVQTVIHNFELVPNEKNIAIEFFCNAQDDYMVKAEKNILENTVVANLVSNAIKFSHPGSTINITLQRLKDKIQLIVEDFGVGMNEELQKKIFNFTEKTSRQGTSGESGTGFGLPLVKSFVDTFNAEIFVQSIEKSDSSSKSGTKFIITFSVDLELEAFP